MTEKPTRKRHNWTELEIETFEKYWLNGMQTLNEKESIRLCSAELGLGEDVVKNRIKNKNANETRKQRVPESVFQLCVRNAAKENPEMTMQQVMTTASHKYGVDKPRLQNEFQALQGRNEYQEQLKVQQTKRMERKAAKLTDALEELGLECLITFFGRDDSTYEPSIQATSNTQAYMTNKAVNDQYFRFIKEVRSAVFETTESNDAAPVAAAAAAAAESAEERRKRLRQELKDIIDRKFTAEIGEKNGALYSKIKGAKGVQCCDEKYTIEGLPDGIQFEAPGNLSINVLKLLIDTKDTWRFIELEGNKDLWAPLGVEQGEGEEVKGNFVFRSASNNNLTLNENEMSDEDNKHKTRWVEVVRAIGTRSGLHYSEDLKALNQIRHVRFRRKNIQEYLEQYPFIRDVEKVSDAVKLKWVAARIGTSFTRRKDFWEKSIDDILASCFQSDIDWNEVCGGNGGKRLVIAEGVICSGTNHVARAVGYGLGLFLKKDGTVACEFCCDELNDECCCPPYFYHKDDRYMVELCGISVANFASITAALTMLIALYHAFELEYGHGSDMEQHCWLLEQVSKSFKMGSHPDAVEFEEKFKEYIN